MPSIDPANPENQRKDLGNYDGAIHSGLAAHFRAGGSNYSQTTYDPLNAFLPNHMWTWISHVARYWFHKKHTFMNYATRGKDNGVYEIPGRTSISLVGDWGTGTDEAESVAKRVSEFGPDFTVHLGDVYFVGGEHEIRENFLGEKTSAYAPVKWPMGVKGSFALTGNHEMYARANGYYGFVLPKMGLRQPNSEWGAGQVASYFCLQNEHWRIIGIDTGYNSTKFDWGRVPIIQKSKFIRTSLKFKPDCALPPDLIAWLETAVNPDRDNRGLILLSHHGSHSSFGEWYQIPSKQLAKFIHRPVIWFWGHEHKLAIYDKYAVPGGISCYGRCIGHGGMPVERGADPDIDECRWLAWDNRRYDNGERINAGYNGYANIVLDGPAMNVEYRDLHGELLITESWQVDLNTGSLEGPHLQKVLQDDSLHFREPLAEEKSSV